MSFEPKIQLNSNLNEKTKPDAVYKNSNKCYTLKKKTEKFEPIFLDAENFLL